MPKPYLYSTLLILYQMTCSVSPAITQEKSSINIQWQLASMLPKTTSSEVHLGLAGPIVGVANQTMIIAGGANFPAGMPWEGGKKAYHEAIYLLTKENGKIHSRVSSQRLPQAIAYPASVTVPEGIIYIGGEHEQGLSDKVILLKYNTLEDAVEIQELRPLPLPLTNLAATLIDNKLYVAGGEGKDFISSKFMCLDLSQEKAVWEELPDLPFPVSHSLLLVQNNALKPTIYLISGRAKGANGQSELYNFTYSYDLQNRQWHKQSNLPYKIAAAVGVALGEESILLCSGDKGEVFSKVEVINNTLQKATEKEQINQLNQEKIALLSHHPGFSRDMLIYNTRQNTWAKIGELPFEAPVTTTLFNWDGLLVLPSGEIKAGVRTAKILTGQFSINQ